MWSGLLIFAVVLILGLGGVPYLIWRARSSRVEGGAANAFGRLWAELCEAYPQAAEAGLPSRPIRSFEYGVASAQFAGHPSFCIEWQLSSDYLHVAQVVGRSPVLASIFNPLVYHRIAFSPRRLRSYFCAPMTFDLLSPFIASISLDDLSIGDRREDRVSIELGSRRLAFIDRVLYSHIALARMASEG